ncbi:hypothetical protein [Mucilaginibacter sp.]
MTTFLTQHFDNLKKLVLVVAQFRNLSPSDCKTLSLLIFKKTNQQVSETTLKRVYGFAYSKFKPSLFTMDAMARYCGYQGWTDFCDKDGRKDTSKTQVEVGWDNIKLNANKITQFTLQALKNRSGIPFNQTIKRRFIDDHFDAFLKEGQGATIITAPTGYGKTIALCHWIEYRMAMSVACNNDDIILFFSSNALINVFISGKDINEWLLSLLGYNSSDDFSTLLDSKLNHTGNFYLIIDGLDEHMFKSDQFIVLLNQVIDIFSFYQHYASFKIVLTTRSSTWLNNRSEFESFRGNCFLGFPSQDEVLINVPLFNNQEIKELSNNINPTVNNIVTVDISNNFSHPLYFQYYYKQHKNDFQLSRVDQLSIYELISTFILNKIYLGQHSTEKTLLIKALIENMDFQSAVFSVNKLRLSDQIKQFNHAYNDLLGIGFIRELNKSVDMYYNTVIEFGNDDFLNYSIGRQILHLNNNVFDQQLAVSLNNNFSDGRKVAVLKWCMMYAVKNGQQNICEFLAQIILSAKEKLDTIVFIGDIIAREYSSINKPEALVKYFERDCSDDLFDYFFGLEFINTGYKKALHTLLIFNLASKKKILIYSALAVIAVIQLDINKLEEYLLNLKGFSQDDLQSLAINPLSCLETIYYYFKYGIVKKEAFSELTHFYFNPPKSGDSLIGSSENDVLYLLAIYTLSICKNPIKLLRFSRVINKIYQRPVADAPGYNFILNLMISGAKLQAGRTEKALEFYKQAATFYDKENSAYTSFMLSSFYLLKLNISIWKEDKQSMYEIMKTLVYLADESDFKLIKIEALVYILKSRFIHEQEADFYKRCYYDFIKLVRESGFREDSFIDNNLIMAIK